MGKRKSVKLLAEQLEQVIGHRLGRRPLEFVLLTRAWEDIVGERAASHTLPAWIRKDVLWVYVDNSVWMQELTFMKPKILEQVNERLREQPVTDVRWLQQPVESVGSPAAYVPPPDRDLDSGEEHEFLDMTKIIDNSGCQQALFRLWQAFHKKMR